MKLRTLIAIATGGAVGALLRAAVLEDLVGQSSVALMAINVGGSFLFGAFAVKLIDSPQWRAGLGVGFCGALTSMSAFAVDVAERLVDGQVLIASALTLGTAAAALLGAMVGHRLGEEL